VSKSKTITVLNEEIRVTKENYISLTDMLKSKDGSFFIADWLRNRNTIEYLGIWERVHNLDFNYGEFTIIKSQSGLNSYKISVKEWVAKTNAIGLQAKTGRYGGTYAHLIQRKLKSPERLSILNQTAIQQMRLLTESNAVKKLDAGTS